jgi:hypothetical protein
MKLKHGISRKGLETHCEGEAKKKVKEKFVIEARKERSGES